MNDIYLPLGDQPFVQPGDVLGVHYLNEDFGIGVIHYVVSTLTYTSELESDGDMTQFRTMNSLKYIWE